MQGYWNSWWFCCTQVISVASVNRGNKVLNNDITGLFDLCQLLPPLAVLTTKRVL